MEHPLIDLFHCACQASCVHIDHGGGPVIDKGFRATVVFSDNNHDIVALKVWLQKSVRSWGSPIVLAQQAAALLKMLHKQTEVVKDGFSFTGYMTRFFCHC